MKNVSTGTILELTFSDGNNFCRGIAWNNLATFFNTKLLTNQTYLISDVNVRNIKPQFQHQGALPIELLLSQGVNIKLSQDDIKTPEIPHCTIENLSHSLDTRVNVVGIIKSYKEASPVVTTLGKSVLKRDIVIADDTNKEVTATLWGENARSFDVEGNPVVEITNSPVKSYMNQATISVTSIKQDNSSPRSAQLKSWFRTSPTTTPVTTAKRRLSLADYLAIDVQDLENLSVGTEAQVITEIESVNPEIYTACKNCKSGIITVLNENFCQKCNNTSPDIFKRVILNVTIKDFEPSTKLFQDNIGCLIHLDDDCQVVKEQFNPFLNRPATFLIQKRCKNSIVEYVILDIDFLQNKREAK